MVLGCVMYAYDYDEKLPFASKWMDTIVPYTKNQGVFHDPSRENDSEYGYAFEGRASGLDSSKVDAPDAYPLIFDSTLTGKSAAGPTSTMPLPGRHEGTNSVGYLDGHAKSIVHL